MIRSGLTYYGVQRFGQQPVIPGDSNGSHARTKGIAVDSCREGGMAEIEHVSVAVQDDFVARQTRAKPIPALAELIWNGLDADATTINVEFAHDDLAGGMSRIVVWIFRAATWIKFGRIGRNVQEGDVVGKGKLATAMVGRAVENQKDVLPGELARQHVEEGLKAGGVRSRHDQIDANSVFRRDRAVQMLSLVACPIAFS